MASLSDYLPAGILPSTPLSPTSASVGDILGRVPAPANGTSTPPAAAFGAGAATAAPDSLAALRQLNESLANQSALDAADQATQLSVEQQRAQLSESTKQQTLTINDQSRAAAAGYRTQQLGVLGSVAGVVQKGQKAMQLSDSQNPMDHLQLWLLQHSDPEYTRVGNTDRLSYLTSAAQAIGIQGAVVQQAYSDQLSHVQDMMSLKDQQLSDTETLAHVRAQVGQARIDSYTNAMKARAGLLADQNQMQDGVLANLDSTATKSNLQKALASPNRTINIGGVDISASALQDRADALDTRDYNMQYSRLQAEKVALTDMDLGQVQAAQTEAAKNGFAVVNGVQISPAQLTARQQEIVQGQATGLSNQVTIAGSREALDEMNQKQLLPTYNLTELTQIQNNGNKDPATGKLYDGGLLAQAIQERSDALQRSTAMQVGAAAVGNPMQAAKESTDYLNSVKAPAGSPLANLIAKQRLIVQAASGHVDGTDQASLASYNDVLSGVRDNVDKGVAAQAKAMSNGNASLEQAYTYQLRGQLIPDATLSDALISQISTNKPVNQWLSPPLAAVFTQTYQKVLNSSNQVSADGSMPLDLPSRKQAAAQQAIDAVRAAASSGVTDQVFAAQATDPASPINQAGIQPNRILALIHNADQVYGDKYLDQSGYSDADKAAIRAGTKQDPGYAAAQAGGLIMDLNKIKPGLGDSYVNYWGSKSRSDMVQGFISGQGNNAATTGLQSLAGASLVLPNLPADMDSYAQILQDGQDVLHQKQFAEEHANYVSFGADPSLKQVYLLQSTPGLSDNQKQDAYQLLIQPILDQVKAQNMSTAQAGPYIENQLRNLQPDSPQTKALLKAVLAGRNDALNAGDNLTKLLPVMDQYHVNLMPFSGNPSNAILDRVDAHYGWWQTLQKNKGQ